MTEQQDTEPTRLRIRQQNLRHCKHAQNDLINSDIHDKADIVILQEPYLDYYGNTKATRHWHIIKPTEFKTLRTPDNPIRAIILVNTNLSTGQWTQLDIKDTVDMVAIQLSGPYGTVSILNIYNSQHHDLTLRMADDSIHELLNVPTDDNSQHDNDANYLIWAGDFNRHHPMWDEERNVQLFTNRNIDEAQTLIDIINDNGLEMALPQGIPTYRVDRNGNWTRPDNVFCSPNATDVLTRCTTVPEEWPTGLDHLPIDIHLEIPIITNRPAASINFRAADWDKYRDTLTREVGRIPGPVQIMSQEQFTTAVSDLLLALQTSIKATVPILRPSRYAKRWWNKDLDKMRKTKNKLSSDSYRHKDDPLHDAHRRLKDYRNKYNDAIDTAKEKHWTNFLEEADDHTLWTAGRYIKNPNGEGAANPRIPTLKVINPDGSTRLAKTNSDKAEIIADSFFPPPPDNHGVPADFDYPPPLPYHSEFTQDHIRRTISSLPPHKAPGPDQIPNVVYKESIDIIIDHLYQIFNASLLRGYFYDPWLTQLMCVIRKPGRDTYDTAKSHRPITLLDTLYKIQSSMLVDITAAFTEQYELLPEHHFGGRHGRRTTDSMHLLVHRIKQAWRRKNVVSILFLDIEGAFPNAVKECLVHNMRRHRVPTVIVNMVERILTDRSARLRFDDYVSEPFPLLNGIGQGDPISMIIYLFYNADLVRVAKGPNELAVAFVDDTALLAEGPSFTDTHSTLRRMMNRDNGAFDWARKHNSRFEVSKFALIDFTRRKDMPRTPIRVRDILIQPSPTYKFLGVIFDQELRWKPQVEYAFAKAMKWIMLFKRIAKNRSGISSQLLRRLYTAVAIPKITYAADVWFTPLHKPPGAKVQRGSVAAFNKLTKAQRVAAIAITGCLKTAATDYVEPHANLMPIDLRMKDLCFRAFTRLVSLKGKHPLVEVVRKATSRPAKHNLSPIDILHALTSLKQGDIAPIILPVVEDFTRDAFNCHIPKDRETSIRMEATDEALVKVYTDGSATATGVGASAVLIDSISGVTQVRKFHLGNPTDHIGYEGEVVGLTLALHQIVELPHRNSISIYTDNQAGLKAINAPPEGNAGYLIQNLVVQMKAIRERRPNFARGIVFRWISAHSGVPGNEKADAEAKKAAEGRSSRRDLLPSLLRKPLPKSATATKRVFRDKIMNEWTTRRRTSRQKGRMDLIDPSFTPSRFQTLIDSLHRNDSTILNRIRSNHLPLNVFLHRIKRAENPTCTQCGLADETTRHFLFECSAFREVRRATLDGLGRDSRNTRFLLSTKEGAKVLLSYVKNTRRLEPDRPGEREGIG